MGYAVTGGAGFIGSHLADALLLRGDTVIVIDDFSSGKEENLRAHQNNKKLIAYKKSICDDVSDIFKKHKIDVVFHLAANPGVQFSIQHPIESHQVNVDGTLNVLHAANRCGVKRVIFASSAAVYGETIQMPLHETMTPNPASPYALQKLIGEQYCQLFTRLYDIETVILRFFNVFGPRQNPQGDYGFLIPKFITLVNNNKSPIIYGDGEQTRDFIYVSDVVEALMLAANADKTCIGNIFNIGTGKNTSIKEIAKLIIGLGNATVAPKHGRAIIEPRHSVADISRAKKMLGWEPQIALENGLKKTHQYFSDNAL